MPKIEIFKPGTFVSMGGEEITFSENELIACAECYDPKLLQAPLVVGHPKTDDPAYGQVKNLEIENGRLVAIPEHVEPQFAELVNAKRYSRVSAAFYTPESKSNPKPGNYYLRHVGFLGAAAPAVKGLKSPAFQDGESGVIVVEFSEEKPSEPIKAFKPKKTQEGKMPTQEELAKQQAEFAEKQAELERQQAELKEREQQLADKELEQKKASTAEFVEGLVKKAKIAPAMKDGLVDVLMNIDDKQSFEFAENGKTTKQDTKKFFKDFLKSLPAKVEFSELAGGDAGSSEMTPEQVAEKAQIYQDEQAKLGRDVRFSECVEAVKKGVK